jgi:hypothetical protein
LWTEFNFYEHGDEPWSFIKDEKFHDYVSDCWYFKKNCQIELWYILFHTGRSMIELEVIQIAFFYNYKISRGLEVGYRCLN